MSKKLGIIVASLAAGFLLASPAQAATGNVTIQAQVLKPVELSGGGTMNLGTIIMPSAATYSGTFVLSAAASQSGTYCASGFSCTGTPAAAAFNLRGSKSSVVSVKIPTQIVLTLQGWTGGGTTPTIALTTSNSLAANNPSGTYPVTLPNSGAPGLDFYVGGSFTVNQTTEGGDYVGTFAVTADYQ